MRWVRYFDWRRNVVIEVEGSTWVGLGWEFDRSPGGWRVGIKVGLVFGQARFLFVNRTNGKAR